MYHILAHSAGYLVQLLGVLLYKAHEVNEVDSLVLLYGYVGYVVLHHDLGVDTHHSHAEELEIQLLDFLCGKIGCRLRELRCNAAHLKLALSKELHLIDLSCYVSAIELEVYGRVHLVVFRERLNRIVDPIHKGELEPLRLKDSETRREHIAFNEIGEARE